MEQLLEPLRKKLESERLLEADWPKIVEGLKALGAKNGTNDAKTLEEFYGEAMSPDLVAKLVASETRRVAIKNRAAKFSIDRIVVNFLKGNMFFMEVSRWIRKHAGHYWKTMPVPTAAMCYDVERDDFTMVYNPEFFASFLVDFGEVEGTKIIEGIFHHELYHFTLKHLTVRRRSPALAWNIGTDAAINSLILAAGGTLPECGIIPHQAWKEPELRVDLRRGGMQRDLSPEEKMMQKGLNDLITGWERGSSSDWYYTDLMRWAREGGHKVTDGGIIPKGGKSPIEKIFESLDMHDFWDQVPEAEREMMQEKMKDILRGAVRKADNEQNGWGSIPADIQKALRSYVDDRVDWDQALRTFVGSFQRGDRRNTFKRINRRTPYDHPGTRRTHLPRIAVAIDQSGSVDDNQVAIIFGVLGSLAKKVTFTVVPFDSVVHEKGIFEWKKGTLPPVKRVAQGGTDFRVACDYINDGKAGKVDGYIVITDGECSDPGHSRIRRAWVITPGHKLYFPTRDLVINMDEKKPGKDAELR